MKTQKQEAEPIAWCSVIRRIIRTLLFWYDNIHPGWKCFVFFAQSFFSTVYFSVQARQKNQKLFWLYMTAGFWPVLGLGCSSNAVTLMQHDQLFFFHSCPSKITISGPSDWTEVGPSWLLEPLRASSSWFKPVRTEVFSSSISDQTKWHYFYLPLCHDTSSVPGCLPNRTTIY